MDTLTYAFMKKKLEFRLRKEMIQAGLDPAHTPLVGDGETEWPVGEQMLARMVTAALVVFEGASDGWTSDQ